MHDQPKTRPSLILRLRHPDDAVAWQEFIDIYQPLIFRLARSRGLQEADAFDATQEVLARVAGAINRWDPDPQLGSFRGWISRITRNLVIQLLRSKNRLPATGDDSAIQQLIEQTPDRCQESDLFDLEHERQVFAWAANQVEHQFAPQTWQAFWQTSVDRVPVGDVAAKLKMTAGAVYIARSRVMARLRETVLNHLQQDRIKSGFDTSRQRSSAGESPS